MGAESSGICMISAMDRLWFHRIILLSHQSHFLSPPSSEEKPIPFSQSPNYNSSRNITAISDEQEASQITCSQDEATGQENDYHEEDKEAITKQQEERERPTRLNLVFTTKTRSHSSTPSSSSSQKQLSRNNRRRLQKTMSCKSFGDLELEEVKGFMDLGFIFKKEFLCTRLMRLIPGLQRIQFNGKDRNDLEEEEEEDDEYDEEKKQGMVMRPYLSEAWVVRRRTNSPLLDLRITGVSTAADMKKHLKFWARSVASAIHQQS